MKPPRVEHGHWVPGPDGVPNSTTYRDRYHPAGDPGAQARHVFLGGNGLPGRWAGRDRFTVLETGFGLGHNFLATWTAWADDPKRPRRLSFVSIERHPLGAADLASAWQASGPVGEADAARRAELLAQWPVRTPDLHRLTWSQDGAGRAGGVGQVELLVAFGDVHDWLGRLELEADAIYLDGFAPSRNPAMWDEHVARGLARLAAPDATLATWSAARRVREALAAAGFVTERRPGLAPKRDMTVGRRHAGAAQAAAAQRPASTYRESTAPWRTPARHACVIGAGVAGCAAAHALVGAGWTVDLLDAAPRLAAGASGNPAAIFHGTVLAEDGPHARWNRAATLAAAREYRRLIAATGMPGEVDGLLRLERTLSGAELPARIEALGLPPDHVDPLGPADAAAWAGLPRTAGPAWAMHQAGWVVPSAVCEAWAREAGEAWRFRGGCDVAGLRPADGLWQALDPEGRVLAQAKVMVVAAAQWTPALLGAHTDAATWPAGAIRGQVSWLEAGVAPTAAPRRPVAGQGYVLGLPGGSLLFGATAQPGDPEQQARLEDDRFNLARLADLGFVDPEVATAQASAWLAEGKLHHRAAHRWTLVDRLPVVGPVVDPAVGSAPAREGSAWRALRAWPRVAGLQVLAGLGSRGLTWAPLAAQLLVARLEGCPWPVERGLAERLDPARFALARERAPRR